MIALWVGPGVLTEMDTVLTRKSPASKSSLVILLDRARIHVGSSAEPAACVQAQAVVAYASDANIVAEALTTQVDYLVSLDHQHLVNNPQVQTLPFLIGTPGDCLAWLRAQLF